GVHFFDMLMWIFGDVARHEVHVADESKMSGFMELEKANVRWFLSSDRNDLPEAVRKDGKTTFRSITVDEEEIEFSGGFTDLHTMVYQDILSGKGFGIEDVRPSINLVHEIKIDKKVNNKANYHPLLGAGS
ncbi:MAG: oxidoreductase, partial [Deltaproteobacteria bacterium]|nr:oxidoreductase [Deltaproteobacteria bacterium]